MTILRYFTLLLPIVSLSACATTDVTKAKLVAGKGKAGVIVSIDKSFPAYQTLDLSGYNPEKLDDEGRVKLSGDYATLKLAKNQDGFVFTTLKPGKYLIRGLTQQLKWTACFQDQTYAFEVKPDTISYIGRYNPIINSIQLQSAAQKSGKIVSRNQQSFFFMDDIVPPTIIAPNLSGQKAAAKFVTANAPGIELPVENIELTKVKFQTGKSLFGGPVCHTGY